MRNSFVAFTLAALIAASMLASSAFNYADLEPRTVDVTIVADQNAYLAVQSHDTDYACYVAETNGVIDVTWDAGTGCAGTGTGINPKSTYYFHDVLKITNKGTKTITNVWLNMTSGTDVTMNINSAAGTMKTSETYAAAKTISSLAVGSTYYIGFKIDAAAETTANSPIQDSLSIEARTTE